MPSQVPSDRPPRPRSQPLPRQSGVATSFPFISRARPLSDLEYLLDRLAKLAVIGIFLAVFIHSLGAWSAYLVPVVAAIVFGLILGPPMNWLERIGLPPPLAAVIVLLTLAGSVYLLIYTFAPPFSEWFARLPELWQAIEKHFDTLRFQLRQVEEMEQSVSEITESEDPETQKVEVEGPGFIQAILSIAPPAAGQVVLFFGVLYFYLATRHALRAGILSLCINRGAKLRAARIIRDVETNISRYLLTIALINAGLGTATGIALAFLGIPSPALWGFIAAIFNFVLYIGPFSFAVLLTAVGLVTYDTLSAALLPPAVFAALNLIEGQFVTPAILGRRLTLNPFIIVVALGFWMWLWGPIGAFLALPLLIISIVTLAHILPQSSYPAFHRPVATAGAAHQPEQSPPVSSPG